jgi:DNA anti-recombination protein RmuC
MNVMLSVAIIAVIGLLSFSIYLYRQNSKKIKAVDALKNDLDKNNELLNIKSIELATYKEKVTYLDGALQKIKDLETLVNEKQIELSNIKEDSSVYKTSLDEQKEKYNDFKITSDKRVDELKEELQEQKIQTSKYNDESKNDKSLISQLQTQLEEQNKAMEEKLQLLQNSEAKLKTEFENLASKIFDSNSKKFTQQNQESLGLILNPMKQQLTGL